MEERIQAILKERFGRDLDNCTKSEIFEALMVITKQEMAGRKRNTGNKKLYYISAEFLIGKLLSNNLINLGMYEEVEKALATHGRELTEIEEMEMEPSLGNGGLGRLAACFLDSIATLGLPGDGIGLNYHFGLFRQLLVDHKQKEVKNPWITNESWLVRQPVSFAVPYKNFTMHSTLYDIDVPGYNNGCNRLHLFDVDTVDESIVPSDSINFDKHQIQKNLTLFLYPDDSDRAGQLLRIYQQYFMVSNGAQFILMECEQKGYDLHKLYDHVVIQINDTHPSMVIPELIRLLQERGFTMQEAIDVVSKTCAYTNHTILAEALEKWPIDYLEEVVPHLMPIIHELDAQAKKKYKDEKVAIIDKDQRVHMAHMDIHYGFSVNGVAALHTEILKMRALIDEKVKLLEAKNFDDSFTELEKQRIGYSIAVRASLYPSFRRNMYPDEDYRPGSVFSDFLSSFSINNERLIGAKDYRDFLLNYVYIQGSRGAQGWENYSDGIADYILATVNSPTIKSFLLTQLVYNYICENNGIEGADYLLSVFHQECTDPNKIAYIDGMVELWEKILPGHDAPDFALRDTEGKTVTLEAFRGSYLYIMVWATWCVPCKSELPYLNLLQKKYAGKNIQFLTVAVGRNADEQNTWLNFLHQNPYAGNHTFSGAADKFAEDYMIISVPRFILIGPDGKILNSNAPRPSGQILQLFETLEL